MADKLAGPMDKQARMFLQRMQSEFNGFWGTWGDQLSPDVADALKDARESIDIVVVECDAAIPRPMQHYVGK